MTESDSTPQSDGPPHGDSPPQTDRDPSNVRRLLGLAVVILIIPAALILWLSLDGDDGDAQNSQASSDGASTSEPETSTSSETSGPIAPPTDVQTPALDPTSAIPALQPVPLDAAVDYGNGVTVFIGDVTQFEAEGQGVGEIDGPALRVTVVITNLTGQDLGLDTVTVNLASGADRDPASPVSDENARPFVGILADGESAEGIYSFTVAADALDAITVTLNYTAGAVTAVFTGAVA